MSDEQIWQAVYYAWNLHTDEAEVAVGAELYTQSCAACHGESGRGESSEASVKLPDFSSQDSMIFYQPGGVGAALENGTPGTWRRVVSWSATGSA